MTHELEESTRGLRILYQLGDYTQVMQTGKNVHVLDVCTV